MDSEVTKAGGVYDFLAWLEVNRKTVVVGAVVVLVAAFGIYFYLWQQEERENKAAAELSNLLSVRPTAAQPTGVGAAAFFQFANDYSGTTAGVRAELLGANALFTEGKYAEAQAKFESFLREHPDNPQAAQAHYGIGAALEAQGKPAEAAARYQEIIDRFPREPVTGLARYDLALLHEKQNRPQEAYKIYNELTKPEAMSAFANEAQVRISELLMKHPELAASTQPPGAAPPTNAPLVQPAPQS